MQNASFTPSSRQLEMPSTSEVAMSSSLTEYSGRENGRSGPLPSSPRFNLPDSYWSNDSSQLRPELIINLPSQQLVRGIVVESLVASYQIRSDRLETICQAALLQASTSSTFTSAATAVQQETAASGCCIPPACTIV